MSAFSPIIRLTLPKVAPDVKAESVMRALRRGVHPKLIWRGRYFTPRALLSAGLAPLLVLPKRFQTVVAGERNQFDVVAEWLSGHTPDNPPDDLLTSAGAIGTKTILPSLTSGCVVISTAVAIVYFCMAGFSAASVRAFLTPSLSYFTSFELPASAEWASVAYQIVLIIGFIAQWLAIDRHILAVRKFGICVNQISEKDDIDPARLPPRIFGLRPLWLAVGVAGVLCGAFWVLPMMLAGATHARYTVIEGRVFRAQLADRLREIVALRRPVHNEI